MNAQPLAYFNHAGASLMPASVFNAAVSHLQREMRLGGYEAAEQQHEALQAVYSAAAQLLGCDLNEIALTDSHSRGWRDVMNCLHFQAGDRILVGRSEWGGNYAALTHIAQRDGASLETMPCASSGEVCLKQLAAMLDKRVRLISLTWLPANGGLIQPAQQIGTLARAANIPFFLDAAQTVGQMPVDVRALNCDVLTTPGRKWLRGPRGTGLLYVRQGFLSQLRPTAVDHFSAPLTRGNYLLRDDAKRFETSEANVAARLGLGQAIHEALSVGLDDIQNIVRKKAHVIRTHLKDMPHVQNQDLGTEHSGLIAFTVDHLSAHEVRAYLRQHHIEIALNGVAFTPLDMQARGLTEIARISPHITTTDEEIARLLEVISHLRHIAP
jgi:cysteine desulfurase/selenocysteine lyase